jgi:hypothetical protein
VLQVAGRSPRTIGWYRDMLAEFIRFLERDGHSATVTDLQPVAVRRWLLSLNARSRSLRRLASRAGCGQSRRSGRG